MAVGSRRLSGALVIVGLVLTACATQSVTGTPAPTSSLGQSASPTASPSAPESQSASPEATPSPSGVTLYTVVAGDTLSLIAQRYGTSVGQLQGWNARGYPSLSTDPNTLQTGWRLVVAAEPGVTPLPTPTATTPPVAGCRAGNRAGSSPSAVYWSVPRAGAKVALTFDMGGRLDPALQIMKLLIANKVCATIFPTGVMSQTAIGQQVLALIKAHPNLFEVGNHTMHHCDLVHGGLGSPTTAPCAGGAPSAAFIRREFTDAAAVLQAGTGQDPIPYWRPPYGTYNQAVLNAAATVGYTRTLLWDVDTADWKPISDGGPTARQIADNVIGRAVNGSVVLMHLGGYETLDALKLIVPGIRQRGFLLTSISDLLAGR